MSLPRRCDLVVLGTGLGAAAAVARGEAHDLATVHVVPARVAAAAAPACGRRAVTIAGQPRLMGPGRVAVMGPDGAGRELAAGAIVLAPAARPAGLPGTVADGRRILDAAQVGAAADAPASLVVLGGGATGLAIAAARAAAGSRVTVVELADRLLPDEDAGLAAAIAQDLAARGVDVRLATRALAVALAPDHVVCRLFDVATRREAVLAADVAVIAVGWRPAVRDLGLAAVTVETDRFGHLLVDANHETATPGLYAIGEAVATWRQANLAAREALQAVDHAAGRPRPPIRYRQVPRVLPIGPEAATLGLSAAAARAEGREVRTVQLDWASLGEPAAPEPAPAGRLATLVADAETGEPLGIQLVGARAGARLAPLAAAFGLPIDLAGPPAGPAARAPDQAVLRAAIASEFARAAEGA